MLKLDVDGGNFCLGNLMASQKSATIYIFRLCRGSTLILIPLVAWSVRRSFPEFKIFPHPATSILQVGVLIYGFHYVRPRSWPSIYKRSLSLSPFSPIS